MSEPRPWKSFIAKKYTESDNGKEVDILVRFTEEEFDLLQDIVEKYEELISEKVSVEIKVYAFIAKNMELTVP